MFGNISYFQHLISRVLPESRRRKVRILLILKLVLFPDWAPPSTHAMGGSESVGVPMTAHEAPLELDWSILSGGRLTRLGTREDVVAAPAYIRDPVAASRTAMADVATDDPVAASHAQTTVAGVRGFGNAPLAIFWRCCGA